MSTIDDLINEYAEKLQDIYNRETVGDYTFIGLLSEFARKVTGAEVVEKVQKVALSNPHFCLESDLEFQGMIGAPGVGQSWKCRHCGAPWQNISGTFFRPDETKPRELSEADVR